MGIFGSSKQTSTSRQQLTPYKPAAEGLNTSIGQATNVINDPNAFVTQYGPQSTTNLQQAYDFTQSPTAMGQYFQPVVSGGMQDYMTGAEGLRQTATMDPTQNPYLQDIIEQQQRSTANAVNAAASGAGRYGSGMHTGTLTRELGDLEARMRYTDFANQQARMDAARDRLYGGGATLAGQAGQLDEAELAKLALGQQVGQQYDQRLNDPRLAGMRQAEWGLGTLSPIAAQFGTSRGKTTQKSTPSLGQQIMGAGMMGAGLMSGGLGAGLMGGLTNAGMGGFGGLLGGFSQGAAGMHNPSFWTPR